MIRPLLWEKIAPYCSYTNFKYRNIHCPAKRGTGASHRGFSSNLRIENAFISYVAYIGKMIWPNNLAFYYPYQRWAPWQVLGAFYS